MENGWRIVPFLKRWGCAVYLDKLENFDTSTWWSINLVSVSRYPKRLVSVERPGIIQCWEEQIRLFKSRNSIMASLTNPTIILQRMQVRLMGLILPYCHLEHWANICCLPMSGTATSSGGPPVEACCRQWIVAQTGHQTGCEELMPLLTLSYRSNRYQIKYGFPSTCFNY